MKKIILILIVIFGLNSCLTVNKIKRNCDKFADICLVSNNTKIVYRDTTIYKTDTIFYSLPSDTVVIHDTIKNGYLKPIKKIFGLVWASASVNDYILNLKAGLIDSTLLITKADTIYLESAIKEKTVENTVKIYPTFKDYLKYIIIGFFIGFVLSLLLVLKLKSRI